MKALAKSRWHYEFIFNIHDMNMNSQVAWECIDILKGGDKAHHKKTYNTNTNNKDVMMAQNDKENMRVMHPHLKKLFNNNQPTEFRVIELIKQRKKMWHLDEPITWDEFNFEINVINSMKTEGLNGVLPEAQKSMDKDCRRYVFDFINEFWNERSDFESWHKSQCVIVPKSEEL